METESSTSSPRGNFAERRRRSKHKLIVSQLPAHSGTVMFNDVLVVPAQPGWRLEQVIDCDRVQFLIECARDELYSFLMHPIVMTCKYNDNVDPAWGVGGHRTLFSVCSDIIRLKRQTKCLRTEVDSFITRQRLVQRTFIAGSEDPRDRGERLQDFWTHFRRKKSQQYQEVSPQPLPAKPTAPSQPPLQGRPSPRRASLLVSLRPAIGESPHQLKLPKVERQLKPTIWDRCPHIGKVMFRGFQELPEEVEGGDNISHILSSRAHAKTLEVEMPALGLRPATQWKPASGVSPSFSNYLESKLSARPKVECDGQTIVKPLPFQSVEHELQLTFDEQSKPPKVYFEACDEMRMVPRAMPYVTGHSLKLVAVGQSLTDGDLASIVHVVKETKAMEAINIASNGLLSDKALADFLDALIKNAAVENLLTLNLRDCHGAGRATMKKLATILGSPRPDNSISNSLETEEADETASRETSTKLPTTRPKSLARIQGPGDEKVPLVWKMKRGTVARHLDTLDLGGIKIPMKWFQTISDAIGKLPVLRTVCLADTGLGRNPFASTCLQQVLSSGSLENLDISWNTLDGATCIQLGSDVADATRLRTLNMANCSDNCGAPGQDQPLEYFCEHLSSAQELTRLDLSMNHITYRGALILEDVLEHMSSLTDLNISDNALGVEGIRSMLRLLCQDNVALYHLELLGCAIGPEPEGSDTTRSFSLINPNGRIQINLTSPYSRSFLRMLYKQCDRLGRDVSEVFSGITWSVREYKHPVNNSQGIRRMPTKGQLEFTFNIREEPSLSASDWDFEAPLMNHLSRLRRRLGFRKSASIFSLFHLTNRPHCESHALLEALSRDFILSYPHIIELCRGRELSTDIVSRTLHCLEGGQATRYLTMLLLPSLGANIRVFFELRNLLYFNLQNPTWHYKLALHQHGDHEVALRLLLLDRWEGAVEKRLKWEDISQNGDRSHIRNMCYRGLPVIVQRFEEWTLPQRETLEFDYSSGRRPGKHARHVDQRRVLEPILYILHRSRLERRVQMDALRQVSHYLYLQAKQLRQLLGHFEDETQRAEIVLLFFFRVVDMYNEKVFRKRFQSASELTRLRDSLGHAAFFPFIQPEHVTVQLNLARHDERIATHCLITLGIAELEQNLQNACLEELDGKTKALKPDNWKSWESLDSIPDEGIFRATYLCAPENRHFLTRRKLYTKYGHWDTYVTEEDVTWCTALDEAPADVIEFMEFCVSRFPSMANVFERMTSNHSKSVITLSDFKEGIELLDCHKFDGPNRELRIQNVFSFLDSSGEGDVSPTEWIVLEELWNEMILSLEEFVEFMKRTYSDDQDYDEFNFLNRAWAVLDIDGSGEISKAEWQEVLSSRTRYFGQTSAIFAFMDMADADRIGRDEFQLLEVIARRLLEGDTSTTRASKPTRSLKRRRNTSAQNTHP